MSRKKLFTAFFILSGLVFLLTPNISPDNFNYQEILSMASGKDVIIFFNSGGWGNTPFERADDFAPIVSGIQQTLKERGYESIVIPYNRTKNGFLGKVSSSRDFLSSFDFSSDNLAEEIKYLSDNLPGKKIILAGLSNGGTLVSRTYEKVSNNVKGSVLTIAAGTPFWVKEPGSEDVLQLNNSGGDSLSRGDVGELAVAIIKGPLNLINSKFSGRELSFSRAFHAEGHDYSWSSPEINSQVVSFIESKFEKRN
jgi:hypothetical protein